MHLLYHNFCGLGAWAGLSWVPCFRISSRAAVTSSCAWRRASFKVLSVVIGRIQFLWGVGLRTSVPCWLVGGCEHSKSLQLCLTLCEPMNCSPPGFSVQGIVQARILEWVCHFLLQVIFLTQELKLGLLHCRQTFNSFPHGPLQVSNWFHQVRGGEREPEREWAKSEKERERQAARKNSVLCT